MQNVCNILILSLHVIHTIRLSRYGSHTFKMVNGAGEAVYCKFHYKTDQGHRTFTRQQADEVTNLYCTVLYCTVL